MCVPTHTYVPSYIRAMIDTCHAYSSPLEDIRTHPHTHTHTRTHTRTHTQTNTHTHIREKEMVERMRGKETKIREWEDEEAKIKDVAESCTQTRCSLKEAAHIHNTCRLPTPDMQHTHRTHEGHTPHIQDVHMKGTHTTHARQTHEGHTEQTCKTYDKASKGTHTTHARHRHMTTYDKASTHQDTRLGIKTRD